MSLIKYEGDSKINLYILSFLQIGNYSILSSQKLTVFVIQKQKLFLKKK